MNNKKILIACGLLMAMSFVLLAFSADNTEDKMVNLNNCDLTVTGIRSEDSVMREMPYCVGISDGVDEEFKSEENPFSIITVTLKPKKAGEMNLVPELFIMLDGGLYGSYNLCQGIRIVEPKPDGKVAAFHIPSDGKIWPGHAGDRLRVTEGQSVVIELLFTHIYNDDAQILAASPVENVGWALAHSVNKY